MTTRVVKTEEQRALFLRYIEEHRLPFTADIVKGEKRSIHQNKLQRLWLNEIAEQLGDVTPEDVRGYCKLRMGVPILRAENEKFREKYDAVVKPLPYSEKIEIMMEPLDLPITRLMTTEQKTRYLDAVWRHYTEQGMVLTEPDPERAAA